MEEVRKTAQGLKSMGYKGVMLAYGKEIVLESSEKIKTSPIEEKGGRGVEDVEAMKDIKAWKEGTINTVEMTGPGDFVALKFSGAGKCVLRQLAGEIRPGEAIEEATIQICDFARARGVRLLSDAEQDAIQRGIDQWTLDFQRRYNSAATGQAVVYGTYQAYLRSTPETMAQHLAIAQREGFTLGVKLVRGAYMGSDPRKLFWSKKQDTDMVYDAITEALIRRQWNVVLQPTVQTKIEKFADVAFVLASHNQETVQKATTIREKQTQRGEHKIDMAYGQLMGMADEVSCELVLSGMKTKEFASGINEGPSTYKYLVWGSVGECLKYLVRRAEENRDGLARAKGSRQALGAELGRRVWG